MDKVCVITGGTTGIGYYLSEGFNDNNCKVIAIDVIKHKELSDGIDFIQADLRNKDEIENAFAQIVKKYGMIHILINNAAISKFNKSIYEITVEEFDDVLDVNLRGMFICCQQFIKANKGQKYGRIINLSSVRGFQNEAGWEAYGASKGGVVSLTNTLAISLGQTNITVNAISPGWICTSNYDKLSAKDHAQIPSGRVGLPKDILNACLFLANEENGFINAIDLVVDGGMTKKMIWK